MALQLGDSDTAISYYEELIKNEQYNQPAVWAKIARCYKLTEKWREAVNYYRRGMLLNVNMLDSTNII